MTILKKKNYQAVLMFKNFNMKKSGLDLVFFELYENFLPL